MDFHFRFIITTSKTQNLGLELGDLGPQKKNPRNPGISPAGIRDGLFYIKKTPESGDFPGGDPGRTFF